MRKVRENILTLSGNYPFFGYDAPGGTHTPTKVWMTDENGNTMPNGLMAGQPVVYNPDTGYSIDPLQFGTAGAAGNKIPNHRMVWGVGVGPKGGAASTIKKGFGDILYLHDVQAVTHEPPACGVVPVKDLFYDCLHCEEDFTIGLTVEDDITQNQFPYNRPEHHSITVSTDCCACDDCNGKIDAVKLTEAIVKQVNGLRDHKTMRSRWNRKRISKRVPVTAVQLFGDPANGAEHTSLRMCLSVQSTTCENCQHVAGFDLIEFPAAVLTSAGGAGLSDPANQIVVDVSGYNVNGNFSYAVLEAIVSKINAALFVDGVRYGSAVLQSVNNGDARGCCSYCIEINSAFDASAITITGGTAPTTTTDNPIAVASDKAGKEFSSGVRFIADPMELQCIDSINRPRGIYYRTFNVLPGQDFACGSYFVNEVQKLEIPRNLGYHWRWREFAQDVGGHGRNSNPWGYDPHGNLGLPLAGGRLDQVTADCAAGYHTFILEHAIPTTDIGIHGRSVNARGRTIILVKDTDDDALTAVAQAFDQENVFPHGTFSRVVDSSDPKKDLDQSNLDGTAEDGTKEAAPNTSQGHIQ